MRWTVLLLCLAGVGCSRAINEVAVVSSVADADVVEAEHVAATALGLAVSTSTLSQDVGMHIVVSPDAVLLNGRVLARIEQHAISQTDILGQLIAPLYDQLTINREESQTEIDSAFVVGVHRDIRYATVLQVAYTLAQAGYVQHNWVVMGVDSELAVMSSSLPHVDETGTLDLSAGLTLAIDEDGYHLSSSARVAPHEGPSTVLTGALNADSPPPDVPCGATPCNERSDYDTQALIGLVADSRARTESDVAVLVAHPDTSWQVVVDAADALRGTTEAPGFGRLILAGGGT